MSTNLSANELVEIVDDKNEITIPRLRWEMRLHHLIHRATYAFVQSQTGYFYVQKRSEIKDYCPGFLDATPGGVVTAGESYELTNKRELQEEMGIEGESAHLFTFYFEDERIKCFGDAWKILYDGPIRMQVEEVADVYLMTMEEILSHPKVTPDSLFACLEYVKQFGHPVIHGDRPAPNFIA